MTVVVYYVTTILPNHQQMDVLVYYLMIPRATLALTMHNEGNVEDALKQGGAWCQ